MSLYLGIDIASVDGNKPVDWKAAKAAGCRFAIFRGAYKTWADPTWKLESQRARDAGVIVGAYLFPVMDVGSPDAKAQVAAFYAAIGPIREGDFPPTLDVEFPEKISGTGRSREALLSWVREAVTEMHRVFGMWPMIYTSARVWDDQDQDSLHAVATPDLIDCPLWLARYPFKTRIDAVLDPSKVAAPLVPHSWGEGNFWIHQFQGDAIYFPGFSSTEDVNRFAALWLGSKGERVKWLQRKLSIAQSGYFDEATRQSVMAFQKSKNLTSDGLVGPLTFTYLCH